MWIFFTVCTSNQLLIIRIMQQQHQQPPREHTARYDRANSRRRCDIASYVRATWSRHLATSSPLVDVIPAAVAAAAGHGHDEPG